jgi:alkanesulfonate monooxygenase SsuD/methylene tetrahydromethanopterin reductase-like flavin-dependent oxidoreductase (luciferase family)
MSRLASLSFPRSSILGWFSLVGKGAAGLGRIAGMNNAALAVSAAHADIAGFTGARMVAGEFRPSRVSVDDLAERIDVLRKAAGARFDDIELGLRVMIVIMDQPADEATAMLEAMSGVPAAVIAASPYAFVGSADEVVDKLLAAREKLGVTSYDIQASAIDDVAPMITALAG